MRANFQCPSGSPQPSPEWNPDAEVGADYRIISGCCVSDGLAIPAGDHRLEINAAGGGAGEHSPDVGLAVDKLCHIVTFCVTLAGGANAVGLAAGLTYGG
jgi:hypothetical protein